VNTDYSDVFSSAGKLAHALDNYAYRPEQSAMAAAVGRALARDEALIVEAGTGTGKTFAYLVPALLSAEITARTGRDPGDAYRTLSEELGSVFANRVDAPANAEQKKKLGKLDRQQVRIKELAGEPIDQILTAAPGNNAPIGGVKVTSRGGWFAARPSGTEDIYKIYAESYHDPGHLDRLIAEAQLIVDAALAGG